MNADRRPSRTPKLSLEDARQKTVTEAVMRAIVEALKPVVQENPYRLLKTLQPHEVEAMATAAVSAYITHRLAGERASLNDPLPEHWA